MFPQAPFLECVSQAADPDGNVPFIMRALCHSEVDAALMIPQMWTKIATMTGNDHVFIRQAPSFEKETNFDTKYTVWRGIARFTVMKREQDAIGFGQVEAKETTGGAPATLIDRLTLLMQYPYKYGLTATSKLVEEAIKALKPTADKVEGIHNLVADLARKHAAGGEIKAGEPVVIDDGKLYTREDYLERKLGQAIDLMVAYALRGGPVLLEMREWLLSRCKQHDAVRPYRDGRFTPEDPPESKALTETHRNYSDKIRKIEAERDALMKRCDQWYDKASGLEADLNSAIEVMVRHAYHESAFYKLRRWLEDNYRNHPAMKDRAKIGKYVPGEGHAPSFQQLLNLEHIAGLREALGFAQKNNAYGTQVDLGKRIREMESGQ